MPAPKPFERKLRVIRGGGEKVDLPVRVARAPSLDDTELLNALRSGLATGGAAAGGAATALHDRARPVIERVLSRLLGRGDRDREDLAQKALIELVYTIERFRGDCSLDTWISTLTAHVVYKEIRKRKSERRLFDTFGQDVERAGPLDLAGDTDKRSTLNRIKSHLATMDESKAWTFALHDICGYDLREVAKITDVSVAAAQTRLVRGRKELYEKCAGDAELAALIRRPS
jgi:RNA polymerase sigma-70 factor, ECF subfamily